MIIMNYDEQADWWNMNHKHTNWSDPIEGNSDWSNTTNDCADWFTILMNMPIGGI
jgi:hypothetical protein